MVVTRSLISPSPSGLKRKCGGQEEDNVRKISLGDDMSDDSIDMDVLNERRSKKSNDSVGRDVENERNDRKSKKLKLKSVTEVDDGDLESEDESRIVIPSKAKMCCFDFAFTSFVVEIYLKPEEKFCKEFAAISGLLCKSDIDMLKYVEKGDVFVDKYFSDMTVTHGAVTQHFLNSIFKDDEFAVRMAVLYLVTNYLISKPPAKHVSNGLLYLIGSSEFNSFPWGSKVILKENSREADLDEGTKGLNICTKTAGVSRM
ncbi:hypothetical protein F8388_022786 [Cannabis sativa]|uniref:DUF1985 domain-containing protein n=1 Tax=Cannabis sativa TaxID=3483 RepID=A0A7J6F8T4_CANSA|nr:hypothetical protein F8388_022786 [Cannabis sativa]